MHAQQWIPFSFRFACLGLALAASATRGASPAGGNNTTRWGGSASPNMASSARGLPADLTDLPAMWEVRTGTHQYTTPTIDRGRLYVGVNDAALDRPHVKPTGGGVLMCLEQATGKLIWRMHTPRNFGGKVPPYHYNHWSCGFCSGPVVDGERVYVIGGRGEVLCLDRQGLRNGNDGPFIDELAYMGAADGAELLPTDGDVIWRFDFLEQLDVFPHDVCGSTLLLDGDFLYANTSNGQDNRHRDVPRPLAPTLVVLHKDTGVLVAQDGEKIGERMLHGHWSSPSLGVVDGRKLIYFGGGDGVLYAFHPPAAPSPDGSVQRLKKAWSYDCNPAHYRMNDGRPVPYSRYNRKSPLGPSEIIGTPVFHSGRVYVAIGQSPVHGEGQGRLCCVDAASGEEVWASTDVERTLATVSIADGLLYIMDYSGNLHCFDADTGTRHWVHDLGSNVWAASTFVADGKVYACTHKKTLWVLRAGKKKQVLSRTRLGAVATTPTAVDGVLYLPTQNRLTAYAAPGSSLP